MDVSRSQIDLSLLSEDLWDMVCNDAMVEGISKKEYALVGDAVMSLFVRALVLQSPRYKPWFDLLVSNKAFSIVVQESGLADCVHHGGYSIHGRGTVLEAIVGAIYLQHGYSVAHQFIWDEIFPRLKKTVLQMRKARADEVAPQITLKHSAEVELIALCQQASLPSPEFAILRKKDKPGKVLVALKIPGLLEITETADTYIIAIRTLASRAQQMLCKKMRKPVTE